MGLSWIAATHRPPPPGVSRRSRRPCQRFPLLWSRRGLVDLPIRDREVPSGAVVSRHPAAIASDAGGAGCSYAAVACLRGRGAWLILLSTGATASDLRVTSVHHLKCSMSARQIGDL